MQDILLQVYVSVSELRNMHGNIVLSNVVAVALVTLYLLTVYNTHHLELYTTRACAWLAHMVAYLLSTLDIYPCWCRVTTPAWRCSCG